MPTYSIRFSPFKGFPFSGIQVIPDIAKYHKEPNYDLLTQDFIKDPLYWEKHLAEKYAYIVGGMSSPVRGGSFTHYDKLLPDATDREIKLILNSRYLKNKQLYDDLNNLSEGERALITYGLQPSMQDYLEFVERFTRGD